ncbi:hypothetical protein FACS189423_11430 [Bacteroidia bacterium]|nr:hypothetical protein FACS189423_11430 [Bacteroidia bacterium]
MKWEVPYSATDVKTRYNELRKTALSVKNVETVLKNITNIFGVDEYDKDTKRWDIPSNGHKNKVFGSEPGIYTGLNQMMDWYIKRTDYLDNEWQ